MVTTRFYSPMLGRWLTRDPLTDEFFLMLFDFDDADIDPHKAEIGKHLFVDNGVINKTDVKGLYALVFNANCDKDKQSVVTTAMKKAEDMAKAAKKDTDSIKNASKLTSQFKTWFGKYDNPTVVSVRIDFDAILKAFDTKQITIDCCGKECKADWVAYMDKGKTTLTIYRCDLWWKADDKEKAGVLLHELSHKYAATVDYEYGVVNCKLLATSSQLKARKNADNFKYYAKEF